MGQNCAELSRQTAVHTLFMDITRTLGVSFVPDLFEGMRNRLAYLEAAWELFKEDLDLDSLDGRTKQILTLAITTNDTGSRSPPSWPSGSPGTPSIRRRRSSPLLDCRPRSREFAWTPQQV